MYVQASAMVLCILSHCIQGEKSLKPKNCACQLKSLLDLLKTLGKSKQYYPKWWFNCDLSRYKVKNHLKQIQNNYYKSQHIYSNLESLRMQRGLKTPFPPIPPFWNQLHLPEPRKKTGLTFHYTGCLIGILIMVYYHP